MIWMCCSICHSPQARTCGYCLVISSTSLIPLKHEWCCRPRDWSSSNSVCCQHRFPARFCRSFRRWSVDDFPQQSHWGLTLGFRKLFGTTRLTMIYILGTIVCPRPFHFLPGCGRPVSRLFPHFFLSHKHHVRATGSINLNITEIGQLGQLWNSAIITNFARRLSETGENANAGRLSGNRMFYDNDYMVCSDTTLQGTALIDF